MGWYLGVRPLLDWLGFDLGEALRRRRRVSGYDDETKRGGSDYVTRERRAASVRPMSALDINANTGTDTPADIPQGKSASGETLYRVTAEQLQKIRDDERVAGAAKALGTLKGLGLLREVERELLGIKDEDGHRLVER